MSAAALNQVAPTDSGGHRVDGLLGLPGGHVRRRRDTGTGQMTTRAVDDPLGEHLLEDLAALFGAEHNAVHKSMASEQVRVGSRLVVVALLVEGYRVRRGQTLVGVDVMDRLDGRGAFVESGAVDGVVLRLGVVGQGGGVIPVQRCPGQTGMTLIRVIPSCAVE